jgi:hypothetical protein
MSQSDELFERADELEDIAAELNGSDAIEFYVNLNLKARHCRIAGQFGIDPASLDGTDR